MMKILDTFAGAGGFSLGFEQTGKFKSIGAIEKDKWAAETYQCNNPDTRVLVGNIEDFSDGELTSSFADKPHVILGGPPCQGFSIANKKAGDASDPRNSLFREFIRMADLFKPEILVMENVPNLMNAKTKSKEPVINIILQELESGGYYTYYKILNATDYGIPQIRRRLFVIASKQPLQSPFPTPTHIICDANQQSLFQENLLVCPSLWDAISDLPEIEACEGSQEMNYTKEPANSYQKYMRGGSNSVFNHLAMKHSKRMIERFATMLWGESTADVPDHLKPLKRNGKGELSGKVYDQNNRRMHPLRPCHTIAASFYANFVHPFKHRNFTPREGARIQSFPDRYVFKGKPTVVSHMLLQREGRYEEKHLCQYNQIGNAVPPLLAKAIADNLFKQISKINRKSEECEFMETI